MADTNHEGRQRVYLTVHENFVREDIHYQDWKSGEDRSFNLVTLPMGTVVDGEDLGGWQFSALFVDESRFKGEHWRDIPLLADREVWLRRSVLDAASAGTGTAADSVVGGLSYALQYVAMCVLLIFSLSKSGSWARDALGG